jgi:hypothetical protein
MYPQRRRSGRSRDATRASAALTVLAILLIAVGLATATRSSAADTTLNPPPPSWYTCKPTGSGTVCHGQMSFQHLGGFDGTCPEGFDILENGHQNEVGHRYYDRDGNLIRRVLHDVYPVGDPLNVLYNSETGKSVPYRADFTETDDFAVPGDFDSVTARFTGNLYSVTLPGGGLLVHDAGVFAFDPDGEIVEDHGPKMLFFGDTEKLCAALA